MNHQHNAVRELRAPNGRNDPLGGVAGNGRCGAETMSEGHGSVQCLQGILCLPELRAGVHEGLEGWIARVLRYTPTIDTSYSNNG